MRGPTTTIPAIRSGDSLAFCPVKGDFIGNAISLGTMPWAISHRFCHWGIAAFYDNELCAFESTHDAGLGRCLHAGVCVSGVQAHHLQQRLELHLDKRGGKVFCLPLTRAARLTVFERICGGLHVAATEVPYGPVDIVFERECSRLLSTGYDARAALGSRSLLGGAAFRAWDSFRCCTPKGQDDFLFCSELGVKVYQTVGLLPSKIVPGRYNPKAAARLLVDQGVCGPPEEILL